MANPILRKQLENGEMVVAPGAYDAITARLFRHLGFGALAVPGSQTGMVLGTTEPLTTLTQMAMVGENVVKGVRGELPVILDAGAGFGDPVHVMNTVEVLEDAGISAIHIEDQVFPKRVSYHRGLEHVVPIDVYQQRIEYALKARKSKDFIIIARNDGYRAVEGGTREDAVKRAHAAMEVGADVIMPMGSKSVEDLQYFRQEIKDVPLAYLPVPGAFEVPEMKEQGWQIVIYPSATLTAAIKGIYHEFKHVKDTGYLLQTPQAEQQEFRDLTNMLMNMDEKMEIEAATTEG